MRIYVYINVKKFKASKKKDSKKGHDLSSLSRINEVHLTSHMERSI
jgi:hypothetical protein